MLAGHAVDKPTLTILYAARDFQPVWTEARTQSFERAVAEAESHGLEASAYAVKATGPVDRELLLSDAFLRYASDLARGHVAPQDFETDWRIDRPVFDAAKVFNLAMAGDVATVLAALAPHEPGYEALRAALQRYAAYDPKAWHALAIPSTLKPGDHSEVVPALRDRLLAEGYLDGGAVATSDPALYDPALAAAMANFQAAHGLAPDGAIGRQTVAALDVSPTARVHQIRLNLERWRALPRIEAVDRIEVNVPAATATLYQEDQPPRVMRAVVGAPIHPTPILRARMRSVLLNPPWLVPDSIIVNEIRPALKRDPRYLARGGYVYLEVPDGQELIQVPGPKNSLGRVKFEMPNPDDIYMHDTPDQRLFTQARRYLSHGCVRVEDPRELAHILLGSDQWSRDALDAAIATGETRSVKLTKSLPVYVLYWTAFVDPDGAVEFRDDVYGRDHRLADALAARAAADHMAARDNKGTSS
ncbi:MAG TPA: L,D-transpeptidase family protein [Stellaceae bacterium]